MDMLTILGLFACRHRHAGLLRARGSEPMVHCGVCWGVRSRLRLWLSPRRVALRAGRSNMGWRSSMALASEGEECLEVAKARSDLPNVI